MGSLFALPIKLIRRRRREQSLAQAAGWPTFEARLLKSAVVDKDPLAEEGSSFQTSQVESAFYFTLNGSYYGGHVRSTAVSDSEGHRLLVQVPEDTPLLVRYNPANPDETHALPGDNPSFPYPIWPL